MTVHTACRYFWECLIIGCKSKKWLNKTSNKILNSKLWLLESHQCKMSLCQWNVKKIADSRHLTSSLQNPICKKTRLKWYFVYKIVLILIESFYFENYHVKFLSDNLSNKNINTCVFRKMILKKFILPV